MYQFKTRHLNHPSTLNELYQFHQSGHHIYHIQLHPPVKTPLLNPITQEQFLREATEKYLAVLAEIEDIKGVITFLKPSNINGWRLRMEIIVVAHQPLSAHTCTVIEQGAETALATSMQPNQLSPESIISPTLEITTANRPENKLKFADLLERYTQGPSFFEKRFRQITQNCKTPEDVLGVIKKGIVDRETLQWVVDHHPSPMLSAEADRVLRPIREVLAGRDHLKISTTLLPASPKAHPLEFTDDPSLDLRALLQVLANTQPDGERFAVDTTLNRNGTPIFSGIADGYLWEVDPQYHCGIREEGDSKILGLLIARLTDTDCLYTGERALNTHWSLTPVIVDVQRHPEYPAYPEALIKAVVKRPDGEGVGYSQFPGTALLIAYLVSYGVLEPTYREGLWRNMTVPGQQVDRVAP